ncbi:MAG: thiol reductase thioredoxin [Rhizobiales bacterium 17-65-6]|nr:MAG: thiol reductase thioredoxin [Rhizobiales bacterium 17-65-6]
MSGSRQIVCPQCAGINRVPNDKPAGAARCGKCSTPLFSGKPVEVNAEAFDRHVQRGDIPVLVDVWAHWCGPCRMMAPAFEAAAAELEAGVRLLKVNSEAEPAVSARLGIRSIPTLLLFAGGREIARVSGAMAASQIVSWTRGRLASAA